MSSNALSYKNYKRTLRHLVSVSVQISRAHWNYNAVVRRKWTENQCLQIKKICLSFLCFPLSKGKRRGKGTGEGRAFVEFATWAGDKLSVRTSTSRLSSVTSVGIIFYSLHYFFSDFCLRQAIDGLVCKK